jgi:hypothetical protein
MILLQKSLSLNVFIIFFSNINTINLYTNGNLISNNLLIQQFFFIFFIFVNVRIKREIVKNERDRKNLKTKSK